jgi:hypothetical protein
VGSEVLVFGGDGAWISMLPATAFTHLLWFAAR